MKRDISTCYELMDVIEELGFLPLLDGGIAGFSAEEMVDADFFETKTVAVCFWKEGTITEIPLNLPEGFENLSLTAGADGILYGSMSDGWKPDYSRAARTVWLYRFKNA